MWTATGKLYSGQEDRNTSISGVGRPYSTETQILDGINLTENYSRFHMLVPIKKTNEKTARLTIRLDSAGPVSSLYFSHSVMYCIHKILQ